MSNQNISILIKKKGGKIKRKIKIFNEKESVKYITKKMKKLHLNNKEDDVEDDPIIEFNNLDINENNEVYIFVHYHYLYDREKALENDYLKNAVYLVSILFNIKSEICFGKRKVNKENDFLILDDLYLAKYYEYSKKNDNILYESNKKYSKYTLKFVYLKNLLKPIDIYCKWRTYFNIVDINCEYGIDSVFDYTKKNYDSKFSNNHIENGINIIKGNQYFTCISTKVIFKDMKKHKNNIDRMIKRDIIVKKHEVKNNINKSFDNLFNGNVSKTKRTYSDLFIFVNVRHLFKNTNNLSNSGFLIVSILFYKLKNNENPKLMLDSEELLNYYDDNFENNNIRCQFDKQTSKFTLKIVYLKNTSLTVDSDDWKWNTFSYILNINKLKDYKKQNKGFYDKKLDIIDNNGTLKNRIAQNLVIKNTLNNLVNVCEK